MTTPNLNNDNIDITNPATLEELTDEIRCVSYLITAVGDSVNSCGVPSDAEVFNIAMSRLAQRLSDVAEILDTYKTNI